MRARSSSMVLFVVTALLLLPGSLQAGPKIGVLLKARTPFWAAMEAGVLAEGQRLNVEVIVKAPANESDIAQQITLLNALGAQGIDALVIAPSSKDQLVEPVAALKAKGIRIVVVDSQLGGSVGEVFVGTNQRAAGQAAGKFLAALAKPGDEFAFFKHNQTSGATEQRESGALQKIREALGEVVLHGDIYASTDKDAENDRARLLLEKYPSTRAILASGTGGSMAMMRLLRDRAPAGEIKLVGFGFNLHPEVAAALEAGTMHGWVAQLPGAVGAKGVEVATFLLQGQALPSVVNCEFLVVTKSNLGEPKVRALLPAP